MREIREREDSGHQVSVLSTDDRSDLRPLAVRMFARWTQENFLKYRREHEALARDDDGRALVRELMRTPADLDPDLAAKTLIVRLHPLPSRLQDTAARHLAEELTATETIFPGTDLRLVFTLNGPP